MLTCDKCGVSPRTTGLRLPVVRCEVGPMGSVWLWVSVGVEDGTVLGSLVESGCV